MPGIEGTIYEGWANVQDTGAVLKRDTSGMPVLTSDAKMWLEGEPTKPIKPQHTVKITWKENDFSDAEVVEVQRTGGRIALKFV